jgi:hypothetical protein
MTVSNPTDTRTDIAALTDEELVEALMLSMMPALDHDPYERAHAGDRMHRLREEAHRRRLTLFEAP